jgi:ribosomal protein S18 acetylase RimI-like enzyme
MNPISIETATDADVDAMRRCARKAYSQYIERLGKEPGPMVDDYSIRVRNNDAYVVRRNNEVIGLLVMVMGESGCLLDNVAVDPGFAGAGIGKKLMDFAENQAMERGYAELELYTHELMTENIAMYLKWGYVTDRYIHEKGFDRVYMTKSLVNQKPNH